MSHVTREADRQIQPDTDAEVTRRGSVEGELVGHRKTKRRARGKNLLAVRRQAHRSCRTMKSAATDRGFKISNADRRTRLEAQVLTGPRKAAEFCDLQKNAHRVQIHFSIVPHSETVCRIGASSAALLGP